MLIQDLSISDHGSLRRLSATIVWETSKTETQFVYFDVPAKYASYLYESYDCFLAGAIVPAFFAGEKRIKIDGEICPVLRRGLVHNMHWLAHWYKPSTSIPEIESQTKTGYDLPNNRHAASFLSGGIDSLSTLRLNQLNFSEDHPQRIKDGIMVFGFDIAGREHEKNHEEQFEIALQALENIASESNINLIPVYTNIRHLNDDISFWMTKSHGAALAAVGLALSNRINSVYIGSSYDIANMQPWGSHPILDSNFSSQYLAVHHDGAELSRLEKTEIVANWNLGLNNIRVCVANEGVLNCGKCEKCVRTMFQLYALNKLQDTNVFPVKNVEAGMLKTISIGSKYAEICYQDLYPIFKKMGRNDLAEAVSGLVSRRKNYLVKRKVIDFAKIYLKK
ncbi:hypothetical protein I2I05_06440 [Hymenobacter sp. BT683]|uniref:7-cyano-7-deazaguanine synthase n=1 Tax=Hymenobacter jeongseonensis TaxID=2791027 RepID=A0ABS0IF95_9BACT|nr:hypothetical protein [Hymenobacter jeongseonensis]MBF9237030.1 hypothetical protein [Hymenobacter jeongseonensis]